MFLDLDLPPCDETSSDDDVLDDAGLTAACSELEVGSYLCANNHDDPW